MHEFSIAQQILTVVMKNVDRPARVREVGVKVGVVSGIVIDALELGFEAAKQHTALNQAKLIMEVHPRNAQCRACGGESQVTAAWCHCPICQSPDVVCSGGDDLTISYVEVDD